MAPYQRIVVKLGTSTLTAGTSRLSPPRLVDLARQMAHLHQQGCEVAVVSSGAIAAGRERLNFPHLPKEIPSQITTLDVLSVASILSEPKIVRSFMVEKP